MKGQEVMRAYRITDWLAPARLVEVPRPDPGPHQVRVRVGGCGLCHSDLVMGQMGEAVGRAIGWTVPFTLGHETAGWIDGIGRDVDPALGFSDGDPVALVSPASCGACRWCVRGQENACGQGLVGRGYGRDGGLADYVVVDDPGRSLLAIGGLDPTTAGPLVDAGATSHHAIRRVLAGLRSDSTVVVVGVGGLGGFAVQLLRALSPARVVAVDSSARRRKVALDCGAHHVVSGVDGATASVLGAIVGRDPVDAVLDMVGTDDTISFATGIVSPGGSVGLVGAAGGTLRRPWFGGLPRDGQVFTFQGSDVADARGVIALAGQGLVRVDVDRFTLTDVGRAYEALESGELSGRAVVQP
ncbi:MAG: alcohol dehydrogenase catalytic domain-containing protein [Acidimicrobiales bacterium]